jgi:hypothetical protein
VEQPHCSLDLPSYCLGGAKLTAWPKGILAKKKSSRGLSILLSPGQVWSLSGSSFFFLVSFFPLAFSFSLSFSLSLFTFRSSLFLKKKTEIEKRRNGKIEKTGGGSLRLAAGLTDRTGNFWNLFIKPPVSQHGD